MRFGCPENKALSHDLVICRANRSLWSEGRLARWSAADCVTCLAARKSARISRPRIASSGNARLIACIANAASLRCCSKRLRCRNTSRALFRTIARACRRTMSHERPARCISQTAARACCSTSCRSGPFDRRGKNSYATTRMMRITSVGTTSFFEGSDSGEDCVTSRRFRIRRISRLSVLLGWWRC